MKLVRNGRVLGYFFFNKRYGHHDFQLEVKNVSWLANRAINRQLDQLKKEHRAQPK